MKPVVFDYIRPSSLSDAGAVRGDAEYKAISGGQSLGPMLNLRLARPDRLVDVSRLLELRQCMETADAVEIGAAVTHAEIEDGKVSDPANGMLRHVAAGIAYRAVRNKGTIGGSICHADPAADWVSTMIALGAEILVERPGTKLAPLFVTDFMRGAYTTILEPGDIVRAIRIPQFSREMRWGYYKICRKMGEFADAIGAVAIDPQKKFSHVVCGATGGTPRILPDASKHIARKASPPEFEAVRHEIEMMQLNSDEVRLQQLSVAVSRAIDKMFRDE